MPDLRPSIILDTGALIAIENKKRVVVDALRAALKYDYQVIIPDVAYVEWQVGAAQGLGKAISRGTEIVGPSKEAATNAARALRTLGLSNAHLPDAIVAAIAFEHGGILYTGDRGDMERLFAVWNGRPPDIVDV